MSDNKKSSNGNPANKKNRTHVPVDGYKIENLQQLPLAELVTIAKEVKVGNTTAIQPDVTATAYITALNHIVIDPKDPQKDGFLF